MNLRIPDVEVVSISEFYDTIHDRVRWQDLETLEEYTAMFTLRSIEQWAIKLNVKVNRLPTGRGESYVSFWRKNSAMNTLVGLITEPMRGDIIDCQYKPKPHYLTFINPNGRVTDWESGIFLPLEGPIHETAWPSAAESGAVNG